MKLALPLLLGAIAAPALAQQRDEPPESCANPRSQLALNTCAWQAYERADADLNRMWPRVVAEMRERDREPETERARGRPGYHQALLRSQRAWISFRDAQCRLVSYQARGGSMEPQLFSQCMERLTRERIVELRRSQEDQN